MNCGSLWVTLGSLLAYEGDFGSTLRSLRRHFWQVKATLGSLWNHFSHMMMTLWQLWGHFVVTSAFECGFEGTLASLWVYFGSTCGMCPIDPVPLKIAETLNLTEKINLTKFINLTELSVKI